MIPSTYKPKYVSNLFYPKQQYVYIVAITYYIYLPNYELPYGVEREIGAIPFTVRLFLVVSF